MIHFAKHAIIFGLIISSCHSGDIRETESLETKTVNSEEARAFITIRHNIFSAFRDWQKLEKGYSGTLLYYYQTDGPFTAELYKMYEGKIPVRTPEHWTLECLECENIAKCTAIMTVKFNAEKDPQLMQYEFVNTGFFSPYSEKRLQPSEKVMANMAVCKAENSKVFGAIQ